MRMRLFLGSLALGLSVVLIGLLPASALAAGNCPYDGAPSTPALFSSDTHPVVGETVTFSGTAPSNSDGSLAWLYGDETPSATPQPGGSVATHSYTRPGVFYATVHVKNCAGTSSSHEVEEDVVSPPAITGLHLAPSSFRPAPPGRLGAGHGLGTTISYTLSEAGQVTFLVERALRGELVNGHCVPKARGPHRKCTRIRTIGSFTNDGHPGENSFFYPGSVGGRKLGPGSYELIASAADAYGHAGPATPPVPFQVTG